jgi:triosephosphate isomerase
MNKKIILNWKQNGSLGKLLEFKNNCIKNPNVILLAPFPYIIFASCENFYLGAQNVSSFERGAFTGEVGADMLAEIGVKYCLVGHSERRQIFNETEEEISLKIKNLKKVGIKPILCIGETLEERKSNTFFEKLSKQMKIFEDSCLLAYEPVWSIGTGLLPKEEEIADIATFIKNNFGVEVIYGGSVSEKNIKSILHINNLEGFLIGGTSLDLQKVNQIINDITRN